MKVCPNCKKNKSDSDFYCDKRSKNGLQTYCKICQREKRKPRPAKFREQDKKYAQCYYTKHKEQYKNYRNKSRYGLTTEERETLIDSVDRCCEVCGAEERFESRGLFIHHNHDTGEVEGVLCNTCNGAAGLLGDDFERAYALFNFLGRKRKEN